MDGGTTVNGVLRCIKRFCGYEFSIHVFLMPMGVHDDSGEAHGNNMALLGHRRRGERLCDECRAYSTRRTADAIPRAKVDA
jgi:hypothetical protein